MHASGLIPQGVSHASHLPLGALCAHPASLRNPLVLAWALVTPVAARIAAAGSTKGQWLPSGCSRGQLECYCVRVTELVLAANDKDVQPTGLQHIWRATWVPNPIAARLCIIRQTTIGQYRHCFRCHSECRREVVPQARKCHPLITPPGPLGPRQRA